MTMVDDVENIPDVVEKHGDTYYSNMWDYLKNKATTDFQIYRWTLWFLGGIALIVVILSFVLLFLDKDTSEGLIAIASAAVGAIAGLLAPTSAHKTDEGK